jgi:hypothetical protein
MEWSRDFFPKVFGGVFLITTLSGQVFAESKVESDAIRAAAKAASVYSGLDAIIQKKRKEIATLGKDKAKEYGVEYEVTVMGSVAKALNDKSVELIYKGNRYRLSPNYIEVRIPF